MPVPDHNPMTTQLSKIYEFTTSYYSLEELRTLCFEMGVEFENLGGRTRNGKARELVLHMGRGRQLPTLFEAFQATRPNLFEEEQFDTTGEGLESAYDELDAFEEQTRPLGEKMLRRVGIEQRVGLVGLALIVIAGSALLYLGLREVGPDRMTGDFNIAVAPFSLVGDAEEKAGEDVANSIYGRLRENFEDLDSPIVHVWGPGEPALSPIHVIEGDSAAERAQEVAELAREIDADIVVYGVVDASGQSWQVIPEFFISAQNFRDAAEILGQHSLGGAFTIPGKDRRALRITAGDQLTPRAEILSQLAVGLTYYSITGFDRALDQFLQIEASGLLDEGAGSEVVYLLTGNALAKLAQGGLRIQDRDEAEQQEIDRLLVEAMDYYQKALAIDGEYARAHLGLANVAYLEYLAGGVPEKVSAAVSAYRRALAAQNKPALSDVETKVHFGLGQSYLLQDYPDEPADCQGPARPAVVELQAVIDDYGDGANPRVREMAGEAHALLGLIYNQCGTEHVTRAIQEYETAISLLHDRPERQAFYQRIVDELSASLAES